MDIKTSRDLQILYTRETGKKLNLTVYDGIVHKQINFTGSYIDVDTDIGYEVIDYLEWLENKLIELCK